MSGAARQVAPPLYTVHAPPQTEPERLEQNTTFTLPPARDPALPGSAPMKVKFASVVESQVRSSDSEFSFSFCDELLDGGSLLSEYYTYSDRASGHRENKRGAGHDHSKNGGRELRGEELHILKSNRIVLRGVF